MALLQKKPPITSPFSGWSKFKSMINGSSSKEEANAAPPFHRERLIEPMGAQVKHCNALPVRGLFCTIPSLLFAKS